MQVLVDHEISRTAPGPCQPGREVSIPAARRRRRPRRRKTGSRRITLSHRHERALTRLTHGPQISQIWRILNGIVIRRPARQIGGSRTL